MNSEEEKLKGRKGTRRSLRGNIERPMSRADTAVEERGVEAWREVPDMRVGG